MSEGGRRGSGSARAPILLPRATPKNDEDDQWRWLEPGGGQRGRPTIGRKPKGANEQTKGTTLGRTSPRSTGKKNHNQQIEGAEVRK